MSSNSKHILIIIESAPTADLEASEIALALAAFDLPVQVVFRGMGVFWLLNQEARKTGGKSASKVLAAFPMYDIDQLLILETDIVKYSININSLVLKAKAIPTKNLTSLIKSAIHCFTF